MITIYDIAAACGCSTSTVSKALNNYPDVSPKTKTRILETAKAMGFVPNLQARALSMNKSWNIGVLFEDQGLSGLTHNFFSKVLQGVKEQAEERGYDITFISRNLGGLETSYLEHCHRRKVDGVVIACIEFEDPQIQELMNSEIPVVAIDYHSESISSIMSDNFTGMYELTNYLIGLGHRDIVYIFGHESYVTRQRISGFKQAIEDGGITYEPKMLVKSKYYNKPENVKAAMRILKRSKLPTAIIFPDDYSAIWGINALRDQGIKIPDQISVAGFDGIELGEMLHPNLTTIRQDAGRMGKTASSTCIEMVESKNLEYSKISVSIELLKRGTCKPPRKDA